MPYGGAIVSLHVVVPSMAGSMSESTRESECNAALSPSPSPPPSPLPHMPLTFTPDQLRACKLQLTTLTMLLQMQTVYCY